MRHELRLQRQGRVSIQHHAQRRARTGRPGGQLRIVAEHRLPAHDDRVHAAAQLMHHRPRTLVRDPLAFAGSGGDFAVQRHRPFGDHPGPPLLDELQIRRVEPPRFGFQFADGGFDSGRLQFGKTAAGHFREGIGHGGHHAANARRDDCLRARGRFAVVAAGFERNVHRGPRRARTGQTQCLDFGVRPAELAVPAFADDFGSAGDDAADHRIRLDIALPLKGQFQCTLEMPTIEFGEGHGGVG